MTSNTQGRAASVRRITQAVLLSATLALPCAMPAQDAAKISQPVLKTFYLHNATGSHDINDVATALRNMLPDAKIYSVERTAALTMKGSSSDLETAEKLIGDLDRPKRTWRLTYTVTEIDGEKASAPQHFSLIVAENAKAFLKQGTKVPIVTGKYDTDKSTGPETQVQYIDVGMNFDVTLEGYQDGVRIMTKFEQSAVVNNTGQHTDDPIIAQTTMETTSALEQGKQTNLGSVAEPNNPHHVQVSVLAELVK